MQLRRYVLLSLSFFLFASLLSAAGVLSNRRAPGFSLPDLSQRQHDLYKYRGKVVILNVMRTQCPHCKTFTKTLARAEDKYEGKIQVINVVNPPDNQTSVLAYLQSTTNQLVLFDCGQVAASYLKVTPENPSFDTPHFFVIDQQGWIQDDYGHNALNQSIFEGDELNNIIGRYLE